MTIWSNGTATLGVFLVGGGGYGEEEEASHSPRHPRLYFPLVRSAVPPPTGNKGCGAGVAW